MWAGNSVNFWRFKNLTNKKKFLLWMNKDNISYEIDLKGILKNKNLNEFFIEFLNKSLKNESKPKL
jgi:hypothetical protein